MIVCIFLCTSLHAQYLVQGQKVISYSIVSCESMDESFFSVTYSYEFESEGKDHEVFVGPLIVPKEIHSSPKQSHPAWKDLYIALDAMFTLECSKVHTGGDLWNNQLQILTMNKLKSSSSVLEGSYSIEGINEYIEAQVFVETPEEFKKTSLGYKN